MKPVQVDLAPQSLRRWLLTAPGLSQLVLAGAAIATGVALWQAGSLQQEAAVLNGQMAAAQRRLDARVQRPAVAPAFVRPPQDVRAANAVVRQLNIPWSRLLDSLEAVPARDVAVLELAPDAAAQKLRIKAEAKGTEAMMSYVEHLRRDRALVGVVLRQHEVDAQHRYRPVRFEIEARWQETLP